MGALPSRETHRRGLYSHRHGRNRRNEVVLIPLTAEFFPSEHCPLFERLYQARHHRTAKYYYRALRPASSDRDSDYYCQTTAHACNAEMSDLFEKSFTDTIEGLYHRLVRETEYAMCETDEELRRRYMEQLREQQTNKHRQNSKRQQEGEGGEGNEEEDESQSFPASMHADYFGRGLGAYATGYSDAMMYMKGKEQHTHRNSHGAHVTSPAAFYLRPVPCAIISRCDAQRPHADEGVEFLGSKVKVLGMFGLLPTTLPSVVNGETIEQHLLKATMFVDKDVGDQILGNVVMLGVHMYIRQCIEARIRAPRIPMLPFIFRVPISNIPMLQFVREMRVRLHTLLDAGTPRSGARSAHGRLNGGGGNGGSSNSLSSIDPTTTTNNNFTTTTIGIANNNNSINDGMVDTGVTKQDADAFLFEEDIPSDISPNSLFADVEENKWLRNHPSQNTNPDGTLPVLMMSGVSVHSAPLRHTSLSNMSHVRIPAWAAENTPNDNNPNAHTNTNRERQQQQGKKKMTRSALLFKCRQNRFRIWVEEGRLCVWASTAYARRGCLVLAQQLTFSVDNNILPLPRSWNYRGLLRSGIPMPTPVQQNDVYIVQHDMPAVGLYQGDVIRCSTPREIADRQQQQGKVMDTISPLSGGSTQCFDNTSPCKGRNDQTTFPSSTASTGSPKQQTPTTATAPQHPNYTSNHPSNLLLQEAGEAPPGAFWVHVPYATDNINPRLHERGRRSSSLEPHHYDYVAYKPTNAEEVLLSWIKGISIQTRDAVETDEHWVRDPTTNGLLRIDRYVIRRVEHDGVRYFIGVTPRFLGQQRRIGKGLGDARAAQGLDACGFGEEGEENSEAEEANAQGQQQQQQEKKREDVYMGLDKVKSPITAAEPPCN